MRIHQIATVTANDISDATLKAAPGRALTFLQGATDRRIHPKLLEVGFTTAVTDEALALIHKLSVVGTAPPIPTASEVVPQAIARCESWQDTEMVRIRALMQLRYPEQAAFVFHDIVPTTGLGAVVNIATFFTRHEALENGADRKGSRKADHEALQIIANAGVTKDDLKELQKTVATAQSFAIDAPMEVDPAEEASRTEARRQLYAWVTAWSEVARTVLDSRALLMRLGIAKRRAKSKTVATPSTPPVVVTPPGAPTPVPTSIAKNEERSPDSRAA